MPRWDDMNDRGGAKTKVIRSLEMGAGAASSRVAGAVASEDIIDGVICERAACARSQENS